MSSRCFLETASHGKMAKLQNHAQFSRQITFLFRKPSGKIAMMQGKNPGPDVKHYSLHNSPNLQTNRKWRSCTIHHSPLLKPNVWPQVRHQLDTLKLGFLLQMLTNLRVLKTGDTLSFMFSPKFPRPTNWLMMPPLAAMQTKDQI